MIFIPYPKPTFKLKKEQGRDYVFDSLRKTWLRLTEEEWVRQNFLAYLVQELKYPATLIACEKEIMLGPLKKRFDILVYDPHYQPWMMIECKAPSVVLGQQVLEQVLRYNISVPVQYLIITNGDHTAAFKREKNGLTALDELPAWNFPQ